MVAILVHIARSPDTSRATRVMAAREVLNRAWGQAPQTINLEGDASVNVVHRVIVERVSTDDAKTIEHIDSTDEDKLASPAKTNQDENVSTDEDKPAAPNVSTGEVIGELDAELIEMVREDERKKEERKLRRAQGLPPPVKPKVKPKRYRPGAVDDWT